MDKANILQLCKDIDDKLRWARYHANCNEPQVAKHYLQEVKAKLAEINLT